MNLFVPYLQTWNPIPGINFGLDVLLLDASAAKSTIIVTSIFGELYSIDGGQKWGRSIGGGLSQSVRDIGGVGLGDGRNFGIAGQHAGKQGVAITHNGGITFKQFPADALKTSARYAAYPTATAWYIAAGDFPTAPPSPPMRSASNRSVYRKFDAQDSNGRWSFDAMSHELAQSPLTATGDISPQTGDYGAPPCAAGEEEVRISGLTGSYCAPSCSTSSPCPAAPAGVTAKPQCVVDKPPSKTPTLCALVCVPGTGLLGDGGCPAGATCEPIQGTGVCMFGAGPTPPGPSPPGPPAPPGPTGSYQAQIVKTTDGGATWKSQFYMNNSFYFNGIDCAPGDENTCCAVGEASAIGIFVYCTKDGETWANTYTKRRDSKGAYNMMEIEFVSATEAWACGGSHGFFTLPLFLHTTDGGSTWTEVAGNGDLRGNFCVGLDMLNAKLGYAAVVDTLTQTASVAKYTSGAAPPGPAPPPPPGPAPPGKSHYEDPNDGGCLADEVKVQITGLSGTFCSPRCSATTPCPTDVPDSATASPKCVLESSGSSTPTQCALICKPSLSAADGSNAECPTKATCKPISGTGLCTYDD